LEVELSPKEHTAYLWAAEEEVKAGQVGNVKLDFAMTEVEAVVLEAFRARRQMSAN
jgi:hypothetical protein